MSVTPACVPLDFFQSIQCQDVLKTWETLSRRSRSVIVRLLAQQLPYDTISSLEKAFAEGKEPALTYWKNFREATDLDQWIQQQYQATT